MTDQLPPLPPAAPPPAGPPPGSPPPGWGSGGGWAPPKPDGPAPGVRYAGPGDRLIAYIVDALVVGMLTSAIFLLIFGLSAFAVASASPGGFFAMFALLPLIVLGLNGIQLGYFAVLWYRGGASLGMRVMNIRVVRSADGGPLTKQQAVLRAFGYWVSGAVMYLGFIWILIDDHRQGWHDKIADTVVLDAR